MRIYLGRHVYGLAAIIFGVVTLIWHDFTTWQQNIPRGAIVVYLVAALELFGGVAIQWPKAARAGAVALGIIYTVFALSWAPRVVKEPLVYDRWGNFFEQLAIVSGAIIIYAWTSRDDPVEEPRSHGWGTYFLESCDNRSSLDRCGFSCS